jgi:ankyrin repeat protein
MLGEVLKEFPGKGARVLDKAALKGEAGVIDTLLELGVEIKRIGVAIGMSGIATDDDSDDGEEQEFYLLHIACYEGHFECVKVLVEKGGMDIDAQDDLETTPLLNAAGGGSYETVS